MKRFYERYSHSDTKLLQAVAVLPWKHNLQDINKPISVVAKELERMLINELNNFNIEKEGEDE